MELNNNNNNNNNRAEWEIQLTMQNCCISTKSFEETHTIHTKSEIFMDSDTENVIDKLFNTLLQRFQVHNKHQMKEEASLFLIVLNYCIIIFKE